MNKIDIVIPCFNESKCVELIYNALGYKYCNALFELKNSPKDLVYWRMKVLDSLYCNIDLISGNPELLALIESK